MRTRPWRSLAALAVVALVIPACSSNKSGSSGGVALSSYVPPTSIAIPLSVAGPDQLQSVVAGPSGSFYAAGFAAAGPADPKYVTVAKILSTGGLDPTFGGVDGIATVTEVEFVGGNAEVNVALQPGLPVSPGTVPALPGTGKIVVAATVAHTGGLAGDRDIAVFRLNTDGTLDTTFAAAAPVPGVLVLNLNDAVDADPGIAVALAGLDAARGIAVDASSGLIYVHALQRGEGTIPGTATPRIDADFAVVRITADGDLDNSFAGGDGKFLLDIANQNATARAGLHVLPSGSVIAGGYTNSGIVGWSTTVQPVLYKLTPEGELDPDFADGGIYHETVLGAQTEIYSFAVHGSQLVTSGYGREAAAPNINVWISLRFDVATGVRDEDFGGAVKGAVLVVPSALSSNCRSAAALPGGKTLLIGSTGSGTARDAVFAVLNAEGKLDPAYGAAAQVFQLGTDTDDSFWSGAVSGTNAMIVGYSGAAGAENSYALIIPIQ